MKKSMVLAAAAVTLAAFGTVDDVTFKSPPRMFAPHVWWHWMNGNISKEGITGDLEALADVGVAAATFFDASCDIPPGPVKFDTPEFYDAARHAAKEAKRLGLVLGIANCSGWANSGGPWVEPRDSMKYVTVSETAVVGPSRFEGVLPRLKEDNGFYGDIAVLAVKDHSRRIDATTSITGNVATVTASAPVTVAGISWRLEFPWTYSGSGEARIEISDDGVRFRHLEDLPFTIAFFNTSMWNLRRHTFKRPVTFKALRFSIVKTDRKIVLAEFSPETEQRIEDIDGKTYRYKKPLEKTVIEEFDGSALKKEDVIDLTAKMSPDGRVAWDVPDGRWKILRFGYYANGKKTSMSGTTSGRGPEVDKFDAAAVERHFEAYVGKMKRLLGSDGDSIRMVLNDSYEAESQNWTHGFEREFERIAGYPILQYLPALTGRIMGSVDETEKFLADFRHALSCAFVENYARTLYNKAHAYGMEFYLEPYGNGSFDDFPYARYCDVPMCEFWSSARTDRFYLSTGPVLGNVEMVVKAADAWGHGIVGAEAFTASCNSGRWQVTPYSLKCQCDHAYELGVNRMIFHRFVHQPWKTPPKYPGMTMGPWGMHFDRTQTWWQEAKEFIRYQTRCQYMLQQGRKIKDDICHRQDTEADWYFITSTNHSPVTVERTYAFDGRVPELWYPETGETVRAAKWRVKDGRCTVSIRLPVAGCAFVVFRSANPKTPPEVWYKEASRAEVPGPWNVSFSSPAGGEPAPTTFDALTDWSLSADPALKHFSGSAYYRKTIKVPAVNPGERLTLDLGEVRDFATVTVNGHEHPALWKPPFAVDITRDVGTSGTAEVSIRITNRWPNRLIGDDALPEEQRGTWTSWRHWKKSDKLLPSGLLGPVSLVRTRPSCPISRPTE